MPVIEKPVVNLLTFQVWDPSPPVRLSASVVAPCGPNVAAEVVVPDMSVQVAAGSTVQVSLSVSTSMILPGVVKSALLRLRVGGTAGPIIATHVIPDTGDRGDGASDTWAWAGTVQRLTGDKLVVTVQTNNNAAPTVYAGARSITVTYPQWRDLAAEATDLKIVRGGDQSGASTSLKVGTLDATLVGDNNLAADLALRPNSPVRVIRSDGAPEFTGTISDIAQQIDLDKTTNTKTVFTTISAVDAVQSLANTDRYGVIANSGSGQQSWTERINQLADSALVAMVPPTSLDVVTYSLGTAGTVTGQFDGWTTRDDAGGNTIGALTSSGGGYQGRWRRNLGTAATAIAPATSREFRNLDPSSTYALSITLTLVESVNYTPGTFALSWKDRGSAISSDPFELPEVGNSITVGLQFKPTDQIGTLGMFMATPGQFAASGSPAVAIRWTANKLTRVGDPSGYQLQDVAYESSLLNHIDLACNSVGARWWVAKDGRVQFARELTDTEPALSFGDTTGQDISYTDASLRYDTRNVVNALKLNQHGYDPATGNAVDESQTVVSDSSIRRWGVRASELDTCLYTGPGHEQDLIRRGQAVLGSLSRPIYAVSSFVFNVQSNPSVLALLELRGIIRVVYEGISQTCRVLSITHSVTPSRWEVQVTVSDVRSGPTFADFNALTSGPFADFNTAYSGKSFAAFDADPTLGKALS